MKIVKVTIACALLVLPLLAASAPQEAPIAAPKTTATLSIDNNTFIDANQILMFVTNYGSYGRDLDDVFGYWHGTFWPYSGDTSLISHNIDGIGDNRLLYMAGLWMGAVDSVSGGLKIAVSEYGIEYVPGPMAGGTFMPDDPAFKVYKLYMDSLGTNPNQDYLDWPTSQGAPLDALGNPFMLGRQTLWSVFNDADPSAHTVDAGSTEPLGVEVQQTVWAGDALGEDTIYFNQVYEVAQIGESPVEVTAWIVDREALTGDDYRVIFEDSILTDTTEDPEEGTIIDTVSIYAWHLENVTDDVRVLEWQYPDSISEAVDGLKLLITPVPPAFESFEVVANGSGVVDPPLPGAMASAGFPTPGDANPSDDQQVGSGKWLFHTGDDGGTNGGGTRASYDAFLTRIFRGDPVRIAQVGDNDFEMRFTGSPGNPGVGGSWAWEWATDGRSYWVPFELWRIGSGTPDDPSDDVRLLPYIFGEYGDSEYNMGSYGSDLLGNCGPDGCEHSVDGGDDDPYMNWIYWRLPSDSSPGETGYLAYEAEMISDPTSRVDYATPIIDRTVLVNWNGGIQPPFNQDCPEQGTIFRLRTVKLFTPPDTFTFTADQPPYYVGSLEESSVYIKYKLFNKGNDTLKGMYVGFWSDPDLGVNDNLAGCDTLDDIWFCYNADNDDFYYGIAPPAIGFKILHGPVVPSVDDSAYFDGVWLPDYKNIGMTAFMAFCCPGIDPNMPDATYRTLSGIYSNGDPIVYEGDTLTYMESGDPVTGVGDLDIAPDSRRLLASSGPFDFRPGDSQFVLIKMAVGKGTDNLNSITELISILNEPFDPLTGTSGVAPPALPSAFKVSQNYPNPFNPSTTILYSLPKKAKVTIDVYNILGQRVRRLVDKTMPAGEHRVVWDGTNNADDKVSTGLYFYRVKAGDMVDSKKMLLLK